MRNHIQTIILLVAIFGGVNAFPQKKILSPEAYREWKRIDNPDMSEDGKWIIYRMITTDSSVLYLYETSSRQTTALPQAETAFFWGKGKWICYTTQDSIVLLNLHHRKKQKWDKTENFQPLGQTEWVPQNYTVNAETDSSYTRLVIHHIGQQDSICLDHIGYYTFYNDNQSILYIQENPRGQSICYGEINGPHRTLYTTSGQHLKNIQLNSSTSKGHFFTYPDSSIYSFSLKTHNCKFLFNIHKIPVPADSLIRNIQVSENQEYLTYELHPCKTIIQPRSATISVTKVKLQLWSWDEAIPQSRLEKINKNNPQAYSRYLYHLSSQSSFCFDPSGERKVIKPHCPDYNYFITIDKSPYLKYNDRQEQTHFNAYLVDIRNGESRLIMSDLTELPIWSPNGQYVLLYCATQKIWYSLNASTGLLTDISSSIGFPVYQEEHDLPCPAPSYGIAGWTENENLVGIYDRYDLWIVDLTNSQKPYALTKGYGRKNRKVIRLCKINFTANHLTLQANNRVKILDEANKHEGIYLLSLSGKLKQLMEGPYSLRLLKLSVDGKYCLFHRQSYTEYRDLWWSRTDFSHPQKITDANPQQKEYNWGTAKLIQWTTYEGKENKGLLYLPEDYDPSRAYPILVQFYETHSQDLFIYHTPGLSAALADIPTFVSNGYIVFMPDIHFTIGRPGESCYDAVCSGIEMLIKQGIADPERIGLQGHSWSGFQTAYLVTRTDLFCCANLGAPVCDMPMAYASVRNGSGRVRFFMYEDTQSRMGKTLWEAREAYLAHSPLLYADRITTPLLILHNDADEAVSYEQGRALFLAMRRLHKPAWLINYRGEGHFLCNPEAQQDWTIRMQQFFDYYLKEAPRPDWMKEKMNF